MIALTEASKAGPKGAVARPGAPTVGGAVGDTAVAVDGTGGTAASGVGGTAAGVTEGAEAEVDASALALPLVSASAVPGAVRDPDTDDSVGGSASAGGPAWMEA
jgi:hypothetical protein